MTLSVIYPRWPAPQQVKAFATTRKGGVSEGAWSSFNLGENCKDSPEHVRRNRDRLLQLLPSAPIWLRQEHGDEVVRYKDLLTDLPLQQGSPVPPPADAIIGSGPAQVCTVLTADCLPVLLTDRNGTRVAAVHAGWRGLVAGVLEHTVAAMNEEGGNIIAWLGPGIGPDHYQVGDDVRDAFVIPNPDAASAFHQDGDRWMADLYALAKQKLAQAGVKDVYGGEYCTYSDPERFYSFRRDGKTGRMATLIWLEHAD